MNKSLRFLAILLISISSLLSKAQTPDANNILYVNINIVGGAGTGNSWANAIPQLADALKYARTQNNYTTANPLKIYVAKGTYKPLYNAASNALTSATDRDNAFVMVYNVQIYGGFDPANNIDDFTDTRIFGASGSILSGNIGTTGTATDNTYHLVIASGSIGNALLDGFTIADGNADGNSTTTVGGNILHNNYGAGIYNYGASPVYKNLVVKNNQVEWDGAGMYNQNASPVISNVLFTGNYTQYKGTIINNSNSSPTLANVTITGNTSDYYSGIFNSGSTAYIYNSIIWDNKINGNAATAGADIANDGAGHATVKNSITQSYTTGNAADNNLVNTDPLFTDAANGDYTLKTNSPAIGKGNNAYYTDADKGNGSLTDKDLSGNKRLVNSSIDMGAYENQTVQTEPDANNILYVNLSATGDGSGNTWANAIPQLADALKFARTKNNYTSANPLKIYVAKGTYKPLYNAADGSYNTNRNRDNAFVMVNNVQIYGGFDPSNNIDDLIDARIFGSGGSILSGDIGTVGTATDNTYHVVISSGAVGTARLDGFTVTAAYNVAANTGSVTVNSNSIFRNYGGAMQNYNSSPAIANCSFIANTAYDGGGMYNGSSSPSFTNCNFSANTATYGGGIYNYASSPSVINCTFTTNTALTSGGGMYNSASSPIITNCRFTANTVNYGGGMFNTSSSAPKLTNTTIANNGSNGFYTDGSGTPVLQNTIVWDVVMGTYTATYSLIKGVSSTLPNGNVSAGNLLISDIFKDYGNGDYSLTAMAPVINKGDNQLYWNAVNGGVPLPSSGGVGGGLDLAGNPRLFSSRIDMGAYESQISIPTPDANNILYVNASVSGGTGDGSSWENAIPQLADALKWARIQNKVNTTVFDTTPLKIYVAKGTYKPLYNAADGSYTTDGGRDNAFVMVKNVQLYGGFDPANNIDELTDTRVIPSAAEGSPANGTILSGNIGTLGASTDNVYHVVISSGAVANAVLDGFIVTAAYSSSSDSGTILVNTNTFNRAYGGGMYNYSSSPAVTNCSFTYNSVRASGGGMANYSSSSPVVTNCNFANNSAGSSGGGIFNTSSSPSFSNCSFTTNTAVYGGGMANYSSSSPSVTNCRFAANTGTASGGGMYNTSSPPTIVNCSFTTNTAIYGGGMFNTSYSSPIITNCRFTVNTGTTSGGAMYNGSSSSPKLTNTTIANNGTYGFYTDGSGTSVLQNSIVWDLVMGTYNAKYSLLKDKTDTSNDNVSAGTYTITDIFKDYANGDYTLKSYSPAINEGSNTLFAGLDANTKDLLGNARVYNYATSGTIDLGAYEYQSTDIVPDANNIVYVNTAVIGSTGNGSSWANAVKELADALKFARIKYDANNTVFDTTPLKIYVAKGTYKPLYNAANGSYTTDGGGDNAFVMVNNVQLYGGFDPANNITDLTHARQLPPTVVGGAGGGLGSILSGDLDNSGTPNANDAYHVVISSGEVGTARLDGFTVTGAYDTSANTTGITVNSNLVYRNYGGGMSNKSSDPTVANCSFTSNWTIYGGAMYNYNSSPSLTNCSFTTNVAISGGVMYNNVSSPKVTNCSFTSNTATYGGAMFNNSSLPKVTNCNFTVNTGTILGGAMYNGTYSLPTITNTTIANNGTSGFYIESGSTSVLQNSIVWDAVTGAYTAKYSLIKDKTDTSNGNINAIGLAATDIFKDDAGGDYTLKSYSPAINKGSKQLYWDVVNGGVAPPSLGGAGGGLDLAGNPRVYKYADDGIIDLGAYEYQTTDIVPDANNIVYVNVAVSGGAGNGSSWTNAVNELADALKFARTKNNFTSGNPLKIYVAKGTYKPMYNAADGSYTTDGGRDNAFVMVKNVQIYGGFDPANNITDLTHARQLPSSGGAGGGSGGFGSILSGDIGTEGTNTDNTYHVVISSGVAVETAKLDGFTVTGGYSASSDNYAIVVNGVAIIRRNGGGMYNTTFYSPPAITNCNFTGNSAGANGGGIYNTASSSSPLVITNCSFAANTANTGGGMCNSSSSSVIVNCSFTANTANNVGGGMYNNSSSPTITNTTIANNASSGFYNSSSTPVLQNSIVWDAVSGAYTAKYSLIKDKTDTGNGNINATGLAATDIFTNPSTGDYTLKSYSPAINKGDNALFTGLDANTKDLLGNPRVYNYATGGTIDLGAYEYQSVDIVPDANNIIYVNVAVSGGAGNGSSWANATINLADALKFARTKYDANNAVFDTTPLKIYVAKGTYKPLYNAADGSYTTNGDRDNAFVMVKNVKIYGGFDLDNNIDDLTDTRSYTNTILSGDLDNSGTRNANDAYHVVMSSGAVGTALLDGFTVTGSYSTLSNTTSISVNNNVFYRYSGGGMYNNSSSPVIANCNFTANTAYMAGGMYNNSSSPVIANCNFTANTAYVAGGMYNNSPSSLPTITNCSFTANRATNGGGAMYNQTSSPTVTNCSFKGNVAGSSGGGMYNSYSSAIITNGSFTGNTATISGGGMYNNSSSPAIVNSIFTTNAALANGGAIYGVQASPTITNTTIANNGSTGFYNGAMSLPVFQNSIVWDAVTGSGYPVTYSLIKGASSTANGNINATGLVATDIFTNPSTGDYTLKASSPAVNKGNNALFTGLEANTKDIVGNARVYNFSDGGTIDLGAYESTYSLTPVLSAFANISKTYGDADFTLTAPTSTSNGAFTYSSSDGYVAIIIGNAVSIVGAGTATITATQAATANYSGNTISLTLTVGKGSQTISFAALNPKTTSSADFALTATATSSLAVSYTSSNTAVAEVYQDGSVWKVKIKGEGNTNITAIQNGNGDYSAATDIVQQLIVIGAPLPVTLINFTAKAEGNHAKLQWQTTQEVNSLQFSVYRKSEGNEFVKIGDVLAAINHQQLTINNYIFTDKTPLNGNNYYKLVQIDNNGTATELGIKTITFNLMPYTFNLFPNPTANQVTASFTTGHFTQLQVVDVTGKVLKTKKIGIYDEGIIVDLSLFAKGTYLIKLLGKGESTSRKVVKQ